MRTYLMPGEIARDLKKMPFKDVAESYGMTADQLNVFVEKYGSTSWDQIEVGTLFPKRSVGSKKTRDPDEIQSLLDTHGREEAARIMGITVGTINNYISQMGLNVESSRGEMPERHELEPLLKKHTLAEIADMLMVCPQTVSRWVRTYGLKSRRTMELEARKRHNFKEMLLAGKTLQEISDMTGVKKEIILRSL